jgi:hypothetical protein
MKSKNLSFVRLCKDRWAANGRNLVALLIMLSIFAAAFVPAAKADDTTPPEPNTSEDPAAVTAPDATTATVLSSSVFGVEMYPVSNAGGLNYIKGGYSRWVRGPEIVWKDVETTKGTYDWTAINAAVLEIQRANSVQTGTSVIVIIRGTPDWAQNNAPFSCGPIKPSEYQTFGNFIFSLISELNNRGINYVKYWEIWNEPDIQPISTSDPDQPWGGCWGDTSDPYFGGGAYGEMLKVIYPIIKNKDPNAQVMIGGLNLDCDPRYPPPAGKTDCNSSKFLEGILQAGAGGSFDGVAFHAFDYIGKDASGYLLGHYSNANWPRAAWNDEGPALVQKARFIKTLLKQYGVTGKFLMNTENSLLDAPNSTNNNPYPAILETTKAYYLAVAYAAAQAEGLRANVWFDVNGSWLRNNGIVKLDVSTTLEAFDAFSAASQMTGNTGDPYWVQSFTFQNSLSFPGVAGYEFSVIPVAGHDLQPYHIWMLWSKDGALHTITLPYPSPAVYNVKGVKIYPESGNSIQTLTITLQPYYIVMSPTVPRLRLPLMFRSMPNGNFEDGFNNWIQVEFGLPLSIQSTNPVDPRDPSGNTLDTSVPMGAKSALLGDSELAQGQGVGVCTYPNVPVGYARVERDFFVPPLTADFDLTLRFKYIIYSQDTTGNNYDQFEVYLTDLTVDPVVTTRVFVDGNTAYKSANNCKWYRIPSTENERDGVTSGWATKSININSYKGKTVRVSFLNINRPDGWFNTYTYLDSVSLVTTQVAP